MYEHHKEKEDDRRGMIIGGLIVLGIGLVFLLGNLGVIPHVGETWPLILVVVGVALLIGAIVKKEPKGKDKSELPPQSG